MENLLISKLLKITCGIRILFVCIVIVISPFAISPYPVYACQPPPEEFIATPVPLDVRIQTTPIIFEGTVIAQSEDRHLTTMEVTRYFKGSGPSVVTVTGFGWGTDCLPIINVQDHGIFYTAGNPNEQLALTASGFSAVSNEMVTTIIETVGQQPVSPANGPLHTSFLLVPLTLAGLGIIFALIAILWLKRKQRTQ